MTDEPCPANLLIVDTGSLSCAYSEACWDRRHGIICLQLADRARRLVSPRHHVSFLWAPGVVPNAGHAGHPWEGKLNAFGLHRPAPIGINGVVALWLHRSHWRIGSDSLRAPRAR